MGGSRRSWLGRIAPLALAAMACGASHQPTARQPTPPPNRPIALIELHGHIVFSRRDDVWSARADGSGLRRLTSGRGPEFDPSWSPGGSRIVSGELFVMRPHGSGQHAITRIEGEYAAWSADGRRFAFMSAEPDARGGDPNYDVFVVDGDGSGVRRLTDWPGEDGWPGWSPDGHWIAFTTTHDVKVGKFDVWVMRADGSAKRRVAPGSFPVWSPDGRFLMFSTDGERESDSLSVARPDGSGLRRWPIGGWLPDWRP